jgi:RHS repeat-associated protein
MEQAQSPRLNLRMRGHRAILLPTMMLSLTTATMAAPKLTPPSRSTPATSYSVSAQPAQTDDVVTIYTRVFTNVTSVQIFDDQFALLPEAAEPYQLEITGAIDNPLVPSPPLVPSGGSSLILNGERIYTEFSERPLIQRIERVRLGTTNRIQLIIFARPPMRITVTVKVTAHRAAPPDDPGTLVPPVDPTVATDIFDATAFLYTGPNPVQAGVPPGTIGRKRIAVLRGQLFTRDRAPFSDVSITVLDHPEYGTTRTQPDGKFTVVVNGGERLTLLYARDGSLPIQRSIQAPLRDYAWLPSAVLIPPDDQVTVIDLSSAPVIQVARGSVVSDAEGVRQATLVVPEGTTAEIVFAGGSRQPLSSSVKVRATEYTVGAGGPAAMPGELPPSSGYTYAVEYTIDEASPSGASDVRFNQSLFHYVENYLDFPVGMSVPVGYYDKQRAVWVPSDNGKVIKILSITNGQAELDTNGDGTADDLLQISNAERQTLASLYTKPGQTLWRVPITHFSAWDCNWPYGPPTDAEVPNQKPAPLFSIDDPDCQGGSIIDCQNQALGEAVGLVGTSFSLDYRSDRVPGRKTGTEVQIPLSGAAIPSSLKDIQLEVLVAGRIFSSHFPAVPNQQTRFNWDGKDAFGRTLLGKQPITVRIGYVYGAVYYHEPAQLARAFALSTDVVIMTNRARQEITLWEEWKGSIGSWNSAQKLGGWELSVHHAYDPTGKTTYLGDGRTRSDEAVQLSVIDTVAGGDSGGGFREGQPAATTDLGGDPIALAVAPDGSLYIGTASNIRRVDPDGSIHNFAGGGPIAIDGVPPTTSAISLNDFALAPDGSIYLANVNYIRRIRDGIITTFAGAPETPGIPGGVAGANDGPALMARFNDIRGIAVAADNTLYVADSGNQRIRRIGSDGMVVTLTEPANTSITSLAVKNGSLFFLEAGTVINRLDPDGIIRPFAGQGNDLSDGIPAPSAKLSAGFSNKFSFGPDGSMYIAVSDSKTIRRIGPDGIISTVAGNGTLGFAGDGGPATQAQLSAVRDVAVGLDGTFYIADFQNSRVRSVVSSLPGLAFDDFSVAARDGTEVYVFNAAGRHLRTLNALTGSMRYDFAYDPSGLLMKVTDGDGRSTSIDRDANGNASGIVSPFGQRTVVAVDANGYLANITNPAGDTMTFGHSTDGLLLTLTDPIGGLHQFGYDTLGRLTGDANPSGGFTSIKRSDQLDSFSVAVTSPLGVHTSFQIATFPNGDLRRLSKLNDLQTSTLIRRDGQEAIAVRDGTSIARTLTGDPRWKMQAPFFKEQTVKTVGGLTGTIAIRRKVELSDPRNPLSLSAQTDTITVNGRNYSSSYTTANKTFTSDTPEGRRVTSAINDQGRVVATQFANLAPSTYAYDVSGHLSAATHGADPGARRYTFTYTPEGLLGSITNPIGQVKSYTYDHAGRLIQYRMPDDRTIAFTYDSNGAVASVTPPGGSLHTFHYGLNGLIQDYIPPDIENARTNTSYAYNLDNQLTKITWPDGAVGQLDYDGTGRAKTVTIADRPVTFTYDSATGKLSSVTASEETLSYTYAGSLLTDEAWLGTISGHVSRTYNNNLLVVSENISGANTVDFTYDGDNLVTSAGSLTFGHDGQTGLVTSTSIGGVTDSRGFNVFGEIEAYSAAFHGSELISVQYTRDDLGRITEKTETMLGQTDTYQYGYDSSGRMVDVSKSGNNIAHLEYDANGNRLPGVYDAQDRLLQAADSTYVYSQNGTLLSKTLNSTGDTTRYTYDAVGNLLAVSLPTKEVAYVVDGANRRVAKKVNGVVVQAFLYNDRLRPVAELDGDNKVVSRFVYGSRDNLPDYLVKEGKTYRVIPDHLGSPRLIVDVDTGNVVQRMDYDAFGNVLGDTQTGFQPFGFAGGIFDRDTRLVRFGVRDYDAATGRWTGKDVLGITANGSNLYTYASDDPANLKDMSGMATFQATLSADAWLPFIGPHAFVFGGIAVDSNGDVALIGGKGMAFGLGAGFGLSASEATSDAKTVNDLRGEFANASAGPIICSADAFWGRSDNGPVFGEGVSISAGIGGALVSAGKSDTTVITLDSYNQALDWVVKELFGVFGPLPVDLRR